MLFNGSFTEGSNPVHVEIIKFDLFQVLASPKNQLQSRTIHLKCVNFVYLLGQLLLILA